MAKAAVPGVKGPTGSVLVSISTGELLLKDSFVLREDVNSEKEAQPVSLVGIGSSVLQTSDPTESKGAPWVVSIGTSKLADQVGAVMKGGLSFAAFSPLV